MVGGGSKSSLNLRIFADVYNTKIIKTNVDQDAGSLGAAAIAAVGCGIWKDFRKIDEIHRVIEVVKPDKDNNLKYEKLIPVFRYATESLADISDRIYNIDL
jgi:xylulokinase